jgi:acylpyruvate hydrolase
MASFVRHGKKVCAIFSCYHILFQSNTPFSSKIVAIGRNYAAHAKELNNAIPKEPFFFLKPTSSYVPSGGKVEIPSGIIAHHEGGCSRNHDIK